MIEIMSGGGQENTRLGVVHRSPLPGTPETLSKQRRPMVTAKALGKKRPPVWTQVATDENVDETVVVLTSSSAGGPLPTGSNSMRIQEQGDRLLQMRRCHIWEADLLLPPPGAARGRSRRRSSNTRPAAVAAVRGEDGEGESWGGEPREGIGEASVT